MSSSQTSLINARPPGLVDVLDRILDKGLVIAGDIKISLANVELLTLQIRLLVCSIDKAEQIGLNWWRYDRNLTPGGQISAEQARELQERVVELERAVELLNPRPAGKAVRAASGKKKRTRKPKGSGNR
jgi:hypothetical protein